MRSSWDPAIVTAAGRGDLRALETIVSRFQDMAVATAYAQLSDSHLARDAAQEAFSQLPALLPQLRDQQAFPGWFRQVVRTCAARQRRSQRLTEQVPDVADLSEDPAVQIEEAERAGTTRRLVEGLPPAERTVIALQYIGGYTQQAIAELLHLPLSTVKKRAHDARRRLRKDLEQMQQAMNATRPSRSRRFTDTVMLFRAVKIGDRDTVARLVANNPQLADAQEVWDLDTAFDAGLAPARHASPLIRAAENNDVPMLELLLDAGAAVDGSCGCATAETALWTAVVSGHTTAVAALLERGADPNQAASRGVTPLHVARMRGHVGIAALLLDAGAQPDPADASGRTPDDWHDAPARADAGPPGAVATGIRAIDVFATIPRGGRVRLTAPIGVGALVTVGEFTRRRQTPTLWIGFPGPAVDSHAIAHAAAELGISELVTAVLVDADDEPARRQQFAATVAALGHRRCDQVLLVIADAAGHRHDVEAALPALANLPGVLATVVVDVTASGDIGSVTPNLYDAHAVFSRERFDRRILPAIDPTRSWTRVGLTRDHDSVTQLAREILSSDEDDSRRQEIDDFLRQPFVVAQPWTATMADVADDPVKSIEELGKIVLVGVRE